MIDDDIAAGTNRHRVTAVNTVNVDERARAKMFRDANGALPQALGCRDLGMFAADAEVVALKRGADDLTIVGPGERHDFQGHDVTEVDPTGAGDCFCGTFVSLIAPGVPLFEAGCQANAAGVIAVTLLQRHGQRPAGSENLQLQ